LLLRPAFAGTQFGTAESVTDLMVSDRSEHLWNLPVLLVDQVDHMLHFVVRIAGEVAGWPGTKNRSRRCCLEA
jgi:hypothetical protein